MKNLCVNFLTSSSKCFASVFVFITITFLSAMGYSCPKLDGVYSCDGKRFKIELIYEDGKPKSYVINDGERVFPIGTNFKPIQTGITEIPSMDARYNCNAENLIENLRGAVYASGQDVGSLYLHRAYSKNKSGDLVVHEEGNLRVYATTVSSGFFIEDKKNCKKK